MIKNNNIALSALFVLLMTSYSSAQALTITYTDNWSTSDSVSTGSNSTSPRTDSLADSDTLAVSLFDPSLGILNSVRVIYNNIRLTSAAAARFRDTDAFQRTAGTQTLSNMGITISFAGIIHARNRSNRTDTCSTGVGGTSGATCTTLIASSTSTLSSLNILLTDSIALSNFTGIGNREGTVRQSGSLFTNETNGDDGFIDSRSGSVNASGRLSVIYDYSEFPPVPLPAAFWLFASAISSMFYFRRRKSI